LLNIDTATEVASVCISRNGSSLAFAENTYQREHASFINAAIKSIADEAGVQLKDMEAFAVTAGPGSYTGLRVGMATAKGFCYAFQKPLIAINTLEVMAAAALETIDIDKEDWLCPMIDARRMEVFTALYDTSLRNMLEPQPLILEEKSFDDYMTQRKIRFFGSGSPKFREIKSAEKAVFEHVVYTAKNLATLADKAFQQKKFSDVSYSEPQYFKDFQIVSKR
jgi:tRNA threonylcarbamoyladenosine biosynthesis protein TsaB